MSELKVSDIIEISCCGQGLPIGYSKFKLADMVRELEYEIKELKLRIKKNGEDESV